MNEKDKEIFRTALSKELNRLTYKLGKDVGFSVAVEKHFVDRLAERFPSDEDKKKIVIALKKAIDEKYCVMLYHVHNDSVFYHRPSISFGDTVIALSFLKEKNCMKLKTVFRLSIEGYEFTEI